MSTSTGLHTPAGSAVDLADGRTLSMPDVQPSLRIISPAVVALLAASSLVGFITTFFFLLPDFFQDRFSRPLYAAATGLLTAVCVVSLLAYARRRMQAAQAELKNLASRTPPVPAKDAAHASLLAAKLAAPRTTRFDTSLYFRGAGPNAPHLIFLDIEPPQVPPPQSPGEVVPVPVLRRGMWTGSLAIVAVVLFNLSFQIPTAIGASARGDASQWLYWFSITVMIALLPMVAFAYLKLKQPRFIVPGALCDDARGEHVFITNEESVLTLRPARFPRRMISVTIHNPKAPDTSLYFLNDARLIDFLGRWLLPPSPRKNTKTSLTPASAPIPHPAQAVRSPAG